MTKHIPTLCLTEMVKNKVVRFSFYRDQVLWYDTEDGFLFPVPLEDTGTAMFKAEDKAIYFMRYIRKHTDYVLSAKRDGRNSN